MKRVALYHLETLLWISRLGTFAAAAERLNATQGAVSARMRELENQVGYALFQRAGRNMALTVRARQLVRECESLWASIEGALLQGSQFSGASGTIRIGAGEMSGTSCLPPFLAELKRAFPKAMLEVEMDLSHGMLQKLLSADSDMIIMIGPIASPIVESAPIGNVRLIWVTSPVTAAAIAEGAAEQPIWLLHRHSPIYQLAMESLEEAKCAPVFAKSTINYCNNIRMLTDIVADDSGISFVPEPMARDYLKSGKLIHLIKGPPKVIEFHVAIRRQDQDPLVRAIFSKASRLRICQPSSPMDIRLERPVTPIRDMWPLSTHL